MQLLLFTTITGQARAIWRERPSRCKELAASPPTVIVGSKPATGLIETPLDTLPIQSDKTNLWNVGEKP